jgi:hypothetical protein
MVLDAKALTWAASNNLDTAKLKAAKIPIYGKWYFPEIPPNVPLVNLQTGERQTFSERMLAGEVIYAPEADLRRAGLLPGDFPEPEAEPEGHRLSESRMLAPEPLLAVARPVGLPRPVTTAIVPVDHDEDEEDDPALVASIHMPRGSIAPFVLGVGFCIAFLGLITSVFILAVGLVWMLVGAIGWIRIGQLESASQPGEAEH